MSVAANVNSEMALLGVVLQDANAWKEVFGLIPGAHVFTLDEHVRLWKFLQRYEKTGLPRDWIFICQHLRDEELLDQDYIESLGNSFSDVHHVTHYVKEVMKCYRLRQLGRAGLKLTEEAGSPIAEPEEVASDALRVIEQTLDDTRQVADTDFADLAKGLVANFTGTKQFIGTGIPGLDDKVGGMERSSVTILAGYPSVGKTALAAWLTLSAVERKHPALFLSLEMSRHQLVARLTAAIGRHDLSVLRRHSPPETIEHAANYATGKIGHGMLFIDDATDAADALASAIRAYRRRHNVDLVIVDYLQIVGAPRHAGESRNLQIAYVTRQFKRLAVDTTVAMLLLSQLSRSAAKEKRQPRLDDLRDSGAIEQDADQVWLLHDVTDDLLAEERKVMLNVAKNRNGPRPLLYLKFDRPKQRFEEDTGVPF